MILFSLLELQVFGINGDHALIPGVGLLALCVYQVFSDNAKPVVSAVGLTKKEKVFASLFSLILFAGILLPLEPGIRYGFLLILTLLGITAILIARMKDETVKPALTDQGVHTASALLVYIISFHVGAQIWSSLAFQSVIIFSSLIIYGLQRGLHKAIHDKAFHDWAKYWNAFIGVWCIMLMKDSGVFTAGQGHLIVFTYIILLFVIYTEAERAITGKEVVWILFTCATLTSLDPLTETLTGMDVPSYIQAFLVVVAFDLGSMYFLRRYPSMALRKNLWKKTAVYMLAGIYIFQVNQMVWNQGFDMRSIFNSFADENRSVSASVLNGDYSPAPASPSVRAPGNIQVEDPVNAFYIAIP